MKIKVLLITSLLLFAAAAIGALDIQASKEDHQESRVLEEDYVFLGRTLNFSGQADDLYFMGQALEFNGEVTGGIIALGQTLNLKGTVHNDLRAAGETVNVSGKVAGTLFLAGKSVTISTDAQIGGSVVSAAETVWINAPIAGDLYAGAGKVIINSTIHGDVHAGAGRVQLSEDGQILGNLDYESDHKLSTAEETRIQGIITYKALGSEQFWKKLPIFAFLGTLYLVLSFLIAGLLILLFPALGSLEEPRGNKHFWFTSLFGLLPVFIYPVLIVVAFILAIVFGLTIPMALLLMALLLPLLMVAQILGVTMFGQYLFGLFGWKKQNRHLFFLFGMIAFTLFSFIPFFPILSTLFFASLGAGFLTEKLLKVRFAQ